MRSDLSKAAATFVQLVPLILCGVTIANAADLKVLSGRGFSPVLDTLASQYEREGKSDMSQTARN